MAVVCAQDEGDLVGMLAVSSAWCWFPASSVPSSVMGSVLCFQLTLTILRQTGGLGISIAGGKGSTPYKGDDEVSGGEGRRTPDQRGSTNLGWGGGKSIGLG